MGTFSIYEAKTYLDDGIGERSPSSVEAELSKSGECFGRIFSSREKV
jgi:hypothetical protein